jgi:hypothetical protein
MRDGSKNNVKPLHQLSYPKNESNPGQSTTVLPRNRPRYSRKIKLPLRRKNCVNRKQIAVKFRLSGSGKQQRLQKPTTGAFYQKISLI